MKRSYRALLLAEYLDAQLPVSTSESAYQIAKTVNYLYAVYSCSEQEIGFDDFLDKLEDNVFEEKMLKWYEEDTLLRIEEAKKKAASLVAMRSSLPPPLKSGSPLNTSWIKRLRMRLSRFLKGT